MSKACPKGQRAFLTEGLLLPDHQSLWLVIAFHSGSNYETQILLPFSFLIACSPVGQQNAANKPYNEQLYSSIGDVMLKIEVRENLPNAFGNADIFGRTRLKGISEIVYLGISESGDPKFQRHDTNILSNETTMSQSGMNSSTYYAQSSGDGAVLTGIAQSAPQATLKALPDNTLTFGLDLKTSNLITVQDTKIEVLEATPNGVQFIIKH